MSLGKSHSTTVTNFTLISFSKVAQSPAADLVEFPVKLGWFVVLCLRRILAEKKDQPAVVDVERVVVSVHLCRTEQSRDLYIYFLRSRWEAKQSCVASSIITLLYLKLTTTQQRAVKKTSKHCTLRVQACSHVLNDYTDNISEIYHHQDLMTISSMEFLVLIIYNHALTGSHSVRKEPFKTSFTTDSF